MLADSSVNTEHRTPNTGTVGEWAERTGSLAKLKFRF
jgi:hypothetical protein